MVPPSAGKSLLTAPMPSECEIASYIVLKGGAQDGAVITGRKHAMRVKNVDMLSRLSDEEFR